MMKLDKIYCIKKIENLKDFVTITSRQKHEPISYQYSHKRVF